MKITLTALIISCIISVLLYKTADRPGDDFGVGILAGLSAAISIILAIVYIVMVFWNHRFWQENNMPWGIRTESGKHCVYKKSTDETLKCYTNKADADAYLSALYASENKVNAKLEVFESVPVFPLKYKDR